MADRQQNVRQLDARGVHGGRPDNAQKGLTGYVDPDAPQGRLAPWEKPGIRDFMGLNRSRYPVLPPRYVSITSNMPGIDADGAPRAYHQMDDRKGLDYLENGLNIKPLDRAGHEIPLPEAGGVKKDQQGFLLNRSGGRLVDENGLPIKSLMALVDRASLRSKRYTVGGNMAEVDAPGIAKIHGRPVVQRINNEPYFVSTTRFRDDHVRGETAAKYVDASQIPYLAVTKKFLTDHHLDYGDIGVAYHTVNQIYSFFIIADFKNRDKWEGSVKLAENLHFGAEKSSPKHGGEQAPVIRYFFFPESNRKFLRSQEEIDKIGQEIFERLNGVELFKQH